LLAAATAFFWEVVRFDGVAAEVLALLEPELVSGAVTVLVGPGTATVFVGPATVFVGPGTVFVGPGAVLTTV
jgi:hypothetical protein